MRRRRASVLSVWDMMKYHYFCEIVWACVEDTHCNLILNPLRANQSIAMVFICTDETHPITVIPQPEEGLLVHTAQVLASAHCPDVNTKPSATLSLTILCRFRCLSSFAKRASGASNTEECLCVPHLSSLLAPPPQNPIQECEARVLIRTMRCLKPWLT